MPVELPERVEAVAGAAVVGFPWAAAAGALGALVGAAATLAAQRELRVSMDSALHEWKGGFRVAFDSAYADLVAAASGVEEALALRAGAIVDGARSANDAQVLANAAAER